MATFYSQFSGKVFTVWADAPPAVKQATQCAQQNAGQFEQLTTQLSNKMAPNFFRLLTAYDGKIKELQNVEKKRINAFSDLEKKQRALRSAQTAKEQIPEKIQQCQTQVDQSKDVFDAADKEFLDAVAEFDEERKASLLEPFNNFMGIICQYINQLSLLQPIDFPTDIMGDTVTPPEPELKPLPPKPEAAEPEPEPEPANNEPEPVNNEPEPAHEEPPSYSQPEPEPEPEPAYTPSYTPSYTPEPTPEPEPEPEPAYIPSYTAPSYSQPEPDPVPSYASHEEPAPAPAAAAPAAAPATNSAEKNPFDDDDDDGGDGWGSNPFG
ncbi:hypothetical protein TRFO_39942 [Tritrichomonas foetus]|uniref:BAR domain-containing protein n=1 Tax=Tritrichomonas foetus TaxID=1144522 RepID=A0A1J4J380_9EUKA|nr:hypothetical protein TRFO_39942 [Tritrichomonas foetus]|eukprot:OHS93904.1 hypothetical protein TRFO_39942 [Tritrichomonas foetus]